MAGAVVTASQDTRSRFSELSSDMDGRFAFPDLSQGEWRIEAAAPGFVKSSKMVALVDAGAPVVKIQFVALAERNDAR